MNELNSEIYNLNLSKSEFEKIGQFIYNEFGIRMPYEKRVMLQSRLHKRLRVLKLKSFKEYIEFVFGKDGKDEIIHMIDVVSTNKTDFFREPGHFDFLTNTGLPELVSNSRMRPNLKIWSSACSSGEEPYTIAIVLEEFIRNNSNLEYSIHGTDISTDILKKALA
ncbi:MAG: chemotaxis protein CheR, partial [Marinilabiliales bacterium]